MSCFYCRVLSDAEASLMESSIHDAMDETADMFSTTLDFKSSHQPKQKPSYNINQIKDIKKPTGIFTVGSPSSSNKSPVTQRKKQHTHKIHVRNAPATATDSDPMFALDGFTDDCEPFFESEEEDFSSSGRFSYL